MMGLSESQPRRLGFILLFLIIVLLIVALSKEDSEAEKSHATQDSGGSNKDGIRPVLPIKYTSVLNIEKLDYIFVLGDSSASGHGVLNKDTESWTAVLSQMITTLSVKRPVVSVVATEYSGVAALHSQIGAIAVKYPAGITGNVLLIVQTGAEDVLDCVSTQLCNGIDIAARVVQAIEGGILGKNATLRFLTAMPQVYTIDYADATTGTGVIVPGQLSCSIPQITNPDSDVIRQFELFSDTLAAFASTKAYAHVPMRYILARHGSGRTAVLDRTDSGTEQIDVLGNKIVADAAYSVFANCFFLGVSGQIYQAQAVWAYLANKKYFQVY